MDKECKFIDSIRHAYVKILIVVFVLCLRFVARILAWACIESQNVVKSRLRELYNQES